jgi:SAM-dependent methyltransferase
MKTVDVNCYNCKSEKYKKYDTENGYQYVKCIDCGLVYLNPRPSESEINAAHEIGLHHGDNDINVTGTYDAGKIKRYMRIVNDFYKREDFKLKKLKWLDIGCGFGEFLETLKILFGENLSLKGSEPNKYKSSSCIERGLDVEFLDLPKHSDKYDFISLLNVYSHLPNPIEFLHNLKRILNPGGEIFLETGHSSHLPAKLHHKPYYAPDHLSFANQEIVENILKRNGFEILQTKIYRHEQFPEITEVKRIVRQLANIVLNKGGWSNLFPKQPDRDMFIRARLVD